ncbi:hypothetical protein SAMN05216489_02179 [Streptomyces sp. 3213]|uniref:hypothetical protein n=1 Tax=Streptomyces sp. 3213.3 TaxID=1855348 RepID=UPI0008975DA2|nr:hypothetical protein [Streptomyces sp. 3213.3]SEC99087.1 hypothetical protein SAMN05216489_02179 [Streptomyces sp. 3213] [Streptomyces sp. 3213.3]
MSSAQKTVSVFMALISAMLVLILGLYTAWPAWAWPLAVLLLGAAWTGAAFTTQRTNRGRPLSETVTAPPAPEVERRELTVRDITLPSALKDYDFLFSATIRWCPEKPYAPENGTHHGGLALQAVVERAREVTLAHQPFRSSLIQHELSGALAEMLPDHGGRVRAMALDIILRLSEDDQRRLDRLAAIRKDEDLWEHERRQEKSKRDYLGHDVLQDTGRAVVWWLARNGEKVEKTVSDIGLLAQLTSAANNEQVAEPFRHLVPGAAAETAADAPEQPADLFTEFMRQMGFKAGDDACVMVADQVAMAIKDKNPDTAEEIRTRFAPPEESSGEDGEREADGEEEEERDSE